MSRIDDILSNAALREEPDVLDEREPENRFQFCFMCSDMRIGNREMKQYSRGVSHIMNQHQVVTDFEIIPMEKREALSYNDLTGGAYNQNIRETEYIYIPGFSIFFNLNEDEKTMDNVWNLVWSISCYNNGLLLHNHSIFQNNWNEDQKEFNSMYGEDILNTSDIAQLLNIFWPRMMFYTRDLEDLIFQTKNRYEIMEFRGFHRVRLNNRKYNTKEELIISGRDALEIQEKWWLGRSIINRYIFEANRTLVTETYADEVQKLLEYLVKNVDHSDKRCKLGNSHKMDEFVKGMTLEDIKGYDSIIIGTVRFLEKITIDDDGNIIRL